MVLFLEILLQKVQHPADQTYRRQAEKPGLNQVLLLMLDWSFSTKAAKGITPRS